MLAYKPEPLLDASTTGKAQKYATPGSSLDSMHAYPTTMPVRINQTIRHH